MPELFPALPKTNWKCPGNEVVVIISQSQTSLWALVRGNPDVAVTFLSGLVFSGISLYTLSKLNERAVHTKFIMFF